MCVVAADQLDPQRAGLAPERRRRDRGIAEPTELQRWDPRPQLTSQGAGRWEFRGDGGPRQSKGPSGRRQDPVAPAPFPRTCTLNEKKPVQMMFNVSTFKMTYIGEIFTQILVLPYAGKELNMIIMLPDENTNLKMVEEELSYEKFIE